jgi:hypothetical protein
MHAATIHPRTRDLTAGVATARFPHGIRQRHRLTRSCTAIVLAAGVAGLSGTTGCGARPTASSAGTEPAAAVVVAFLEALKRGDDAAAKALLTQVARAKTEELDISVAPPVNDTATYTVRGAEMIGEDHDIVHVGTTWTDVDVDGTQTSDNVVWVVRLDPEGWRVVGMAMRIFADMPPLLLDFEDPEDMLSKQAAVAEEITRRTSPPPSEQPAGPRTARGVPGGPVQ